MSGFAVLHGMSLLVEAFCVIIRKPALEFHYPRGVDGFLSRSSMRSAEHRYICADDNLVCLSYFGPDAAERAIVPLVNAGLTDVQGDEFIDIAIVDQRYGPTLQCDWLTWERHPSGYTSTWLTGELPGELIAPAGWTVEQSLRLKRFDIRNVPDRSLKLADEDGVETWLDFVTGRIITRTAYTR
jgi:hypothetical protein